VKEGKREKKKNEKSYVYLDLATQRSFILGKKKFLKPTNITKLSPIFCEA
jgi:hypothetical protein